MCILIRMCFDHFTTVEYREVQIQSQYLYISIYDTLLANAFTILIVMKFERKLKMKPDKPNFNGPKSLWNAERPEPFWGTSKNPTHSESSKDRKHFGTSLHWTQFGSFEHEKILD